MELETKSKNTIPVLINVVEVLLRVLNLIHLSLCGIRLAERITIQRSRFNGFDRGNEAMYE